MNRTAPIHREFLRELNQRKAEDYAGLAENHEHQASACIRAKDAKVAAYGLSCQTLAAGYRRLSVLHLRTAINLTDFSEPEPSMTWLDKLASIAAEAEKSGLSTKRINSLANNKQSIA